MIVSRPLDILFDSDGCIANFIEKLLTTYNSRYNTSLKYNDITDFNFKVCLPEHADRLFQIFEEPGFFRDLPVIEGATEVIKYLQDKGHTVTICSSPPSLRRNGTKFLCHNSASDKILWLADHFPAIGTNVVLTSNKWLIKGDILVDDAIHNITRWCAAHPSSLAFIPEQPWNGGYKLPVNAIRGALPDLMPLVDRYAKMLGLPG